MQPINVHKICIKVQLLSAWSHKGGFHEVTNGSLVPTCSLEKYWETGILFVTWTISIDRRERKAPGKGWGEGGGRGAAEEAGRAYCSQQEKILFCHHLFMPWQYLSTIIRFQYLVVTDSGNVFLKVVLPFNVHFGALSVPR